MEGVNAGPSPADVLVQQSTQQNAAPAQPRPAPEPQVAHEAQPAPVQEGNKGANVDTHA
jgi:hypothetical protein